MKFTALAATLSAFLGITSAIAVAEPAPNPVINSPSRVIEERVNFSDIPCKIIGDSNANCRTCDSTDCEVLHVLSLGHTYNFDCSCTDGQSVDGYKSWDFTPDYECFVWAGLTDGRCTDSALGPCAFCSE